MKMKIMTTNIGTINLAQMEIMPECMDVFIPIIVVSENLKATIEENIQKAKDEWQKECLDERGLSWSDEGVNITYQSLHIIIESNQVSYELCFEIEDKNNDLIETGFNLKVDLLDDSEELKKIILNAIAKKSHR